MAGDWIQMRHDLRDDPAVISIAEATGLEEDHVVGKLHRIWTWADTQTRDGNAPNVTGKWLDRYLGVPGFADAMVSAGWLAITAGGVTFPNFDSYISESAKTRALTARRAARHRSRSRNADSVTKSAPKEEKRRDIVVSTNVDTTGAPSPAKKKPTGESVPIPGPLNTPEFQEAWSRWLKYRREIRHPLTQTCAQSQLRKFLDWGIERAIAAIDHTITRGWQGLQEPELRRPGPASANPYQAPINFGNPEDYR